MVMEIILMKNILLCVCLLFYVTRVIIISYIEKKF